MVGHAALAVRLTLLIAACPRWRASRRTKVNGSLGRCQPPMVHGRRSVVVERVGSGGGRWAPIRSLGEGGQARTFLVRDLNDGSEGWVLKLLKNARRKGRFEREIAALSRLSSKHIPPVVDYSLDDPAYLVTQFVGSDLEHRRTGRGSVDRQLELFRDVVVAAADAHHVGIVHRDLKPNNVVVGPKGGAFLVDFGICADAAAGDVLTTTAEGFGNRAFSAPECEPGSIATATPAADVYSLGKLLYWMVSGGRLIVRESFDPDTIVLERSAREVIVPILANTIREDPTQRWTSDVLLDRIDWARARLAAQQRFALDGLLVLTDGFGPSNEVYLGGSHSATTPPQGNPPDSYEVAEAFSTADHPTLLARIELWLIRLAGEGRGNVTLEMDDGGHPSGRPISHWSIEVTAPQAARGQMIVLEPEHSIELLAAQTYWVCLSAVGRGANIAWVTAAYELTPRRALFAERSATKPWRTAESISGPGHALRVLAAADSSTSLPSQTSSVIVPR